MLRLELSRAPTPMRVASLPPVRSVAVASGKGGAGKTCIAVNLAVALAEIGRGTLLLDTDLGLANVDVMLGLMPQKTSADAVKGDCELRETVIHHSQNLYVLPAASGAQFMTELRAQEHAGIVDAVSSLPLPIETLIVDNAAGIADGVLTYCQAAHDVVLVINDDPTSITDTYAMVKVLTRDRGVRRFQILSNRVTGEADGRRLYERLTKATERFLPEATLNYLGHVPHDLSIHAALSRQKSVVTAYPASPSARAFKAIARHIHGWAAPAAPTGNLEFFMERLLPPAEAAA